LELPTEGSVNIRPAQWLPSRGGIAAEFGNDSLYGSEQRPISGKRDCGRGIGWRFGGDTDFHVARNGVELFGRFLPPAGSTSYSNTLSLAAGDMLDFASGRGADNNQYGSGLKIGVVIAPTSGSPTNPPPVTIPALVSLWRGESNALDSAGNNHGTLMNGAGFAPGVKGLAFLLDGINDYVRVPDDASLDLSNELTLEMWFRRDSAGAGALLDKRNMSSTVCNYGVIMSPEWGFQLYYDDPTVYQGNEFEISFSPLPTVGAWHHFAGTFRQADSSHVELRTYIDGRLVQSNALSGNLARCVNDQVVSIGVERDGPLGGSFFRGLIDEVAIYNYALSPSQVLSNYNSVTLPTNPPPVTIPALISLWRGESNALDSVGNNHGALINGAGFAPGVKGQAFRLDGINDYIRIPDSASLDLSNEFTVEMWFRRDSTGAGTLLDKRNNSSTVCNYGAVMAPQWGFQLFYDDPTVYQGNEFEISFSPLPAAGVWHHFAGTFRQANAAQVELRTYIDGQLAKTDLLSGNLARTITDAPLALGSARDGASDFFRD
jgi:hypothetical protein